MKMVKRLWFIGVPETTLNSTPVARHHVEALLDIAVASSVQSLAETRDELHRLEQDFMQKMSEYEQRSKLISRRADKTKFEAYKEILTILADHLETYNKRIEANKDNNGREED